MILLSSASLPAASFEHSCCTLTDSPTSQPCPRCRWDRHALQIVQVAASRQSLESIKIHDGKDFAANTCRRPGFTLLCRHRHQILARQLITNHNIPICLTSRGDTGSSKLEAYSRPSPSHRAQGKAQRPLGPKASCAHVSCRGTILPARNLHRNSSVLNCI